MTGSRRIYFGLQLAADLVGPTVIGVLLDWQFGWLPWATVAGVLIGFFISTYHAVLMARRLGRDDRPEDGGEGD